MPRQPRHGAVRSVGIGKDHHPALPRRIGSTAGRVHSLRRGGLVRRGREGSTARPSSAGSRTSRRITASFHISPSSRTFDSGWTRRHCAHRSCRDDLANGPSRRDGRAVPNPIVRRRAAARRPGARVGERSAADPARRAAGRARPAVAGSDAAGIASVLRSIDVPSVVVTHDRVDALTLGDRMAVLSGGYIRQVGPVHEVFSRPIDLAVAASVGVETVAPGEIVESADGLVTVRVGASQIRGRSRPSLPDRSSRASAPRT